MTAATPWADRPDWTELTPEGKRDAVRPFLSTGLSAAKIAANFRNCTRNAMIGVLHRMKHGGETIPARGRASPRKARRKSAAVTISRAAAWDPLPDSDPITIDELNERTCRWPLWDDPSEPRLYCGAACDVAGPYCDAHEQLSLPTS